MGEVSRTLETLRMSRRGDTSHMSVTGFQNRRLSELVEHAYRNVPFYRRKFDAAGVRPRHIGGIADLHLIPITTRAELQNVPVSDIVARGTTPSSLMHHKTSGSTGEPMIIRRTWLEDRALGSLRAADLSAYGISAADRIVSLGRFQPRKQNRLTRAKIVALRAMGRFTSESISFQMPPERILDTLVELKPDVLAGYPGVLDQLAALVIESGHARPTPRFIITGSEVLTPAMAQRIETAFGGRLYDKYGANELGRIASQCPAGSQYHVCGIGVIAEVLNNGRAAAPGEDGEVVVTGLHSFAMPFIRYHLGDTVTAGSERCDCGKQIQTIASIRGRCHDYVTLPDGRRLHLYIVTEAFYDMTFRWMRHYRVDQESARSVVLRIVPRLPPADEELATIRARVTQILGAEVNFRIDVCAALPSVSTSAAPKSF